MNYFDYMARRGQPVLAPSDVVEWDPAAGIDVIEERLPRAACVHRLNETEKANERTAD